MPIEILAMQTETWLQGHDRQVREKARAEAIDEFAEVLIERLCNEYLKYNDGTWNDAIDEAIKIVKQMKAGGKHE